MRSKFVETFLTEVENEALILAEEVSDEWNLKLDIAVVDVLIELLFTQLVSERHPV